MFIKLTIKDTSDGYHTVMVNPTNIAAYYKPLNAAQGQVVQFVGAEENYIFVQESVDEITKIINEQY